MVDQVILPYDRLSWELPRHIHDLVFFRHECSDVKASITIQLQHNINIARSLMTISSELDTILLRDKDFEWVGMLSLRCMEVMLDTRSECRCWC